MRIMNIIHFYDYACSLVGVLLSISPGFCSVHDDLNVAVIGAGVGGSFAAKFLREVLGSTVNITVYEKFKAGGRVAQFSYGGKTYELGASIIYEGNRYVVNATERLGVLRQKVDKELGIYNNLFSLWNGEQFAFVESSSYLKTLLRSWWRWGMYPMAFKRIPQEFVRSFNRIYEIQEEGRAFDNPEDMLKDIGCFEATQMKYSEFVCENLGNSSTATLFQSEFLEAINRVNYGQTNQDMNAFAGLVSAVAAIDGDHLFQIQGGNARLCSALLQESGAERVAANVTLVERLGTGRYLLHTADGKAGPFDAVVLAAPLEASSLRLEGVDSPRPRRGVDPFQHTHTTYVVGELSPSYFGVEALPPGVGQILVTASSRDFFSSIADKGPAPLPGGGGPATMFKLFSPERPTDEQLGRLFAGRFHVAARRDWQAYPKYSPPEEFQPFRIAHGLAYVNAVEAAASAVEMSAIAARNAALLVARDLEGVKAYGRLRRRDAMRRESISAEFGLDAKNELR